MYACEPFGGSHLVVEALFLANIVRVLMEKGCPSMASFVNTSKQHT